VNRPSDSGSQTRPTSGAQVRMPVGTKMLACRAAAVVLSASMLAACGSKSVEIRNRQPALDIQRQARLPGSSYLGWRVFQDRCAGCHGSDATGTQRAPDLRPLVAVMGPRRFADVVLRRYEWGLPASSEAEDSPARQALLDDILHRREPVQAMPAWQDEPRVNAHVIDLFAYLSERAQGTLGTDPPTR
jgi:hypothetical protein